MINFISNINPVVVGGYTFNHFDFKDDLIKSDIDQCIDYFIRNNIKYISIDTETEGFDPHTHNILCLQIGNKNEQFVIDTSTINWILPIKQLLESPTVVCLMHNAKFDLRFLYKHGIDPVNIYDTFLAECVLTTGYTDVERDLSLAGIARDRLNVHLNKSIRGIIHKEKLSERVVRYAAEDIEYLEDIMNLQLQEIKKHGLINILNLENEAVKVFAKMEFYGVPINTTKWKEVAERVRLEKDSIEYKLDKIVYDTGTKHLPVRNSLTKHCVLYTQGSLFDDVEAEQRKTNINWSSNQQKLNLLTQDLGIKTKSVDDKHLRKVKDRHAIVPLLLEYSKFAKLESSFGMNFLKLVNPITKRVHPDYWQILSTGRISVSEPNVNQVPRKGELGQVIRSAFEAPEGYLVVGGDYSGMELRIIAELSQDPVWINAFNEGKDLHSVLCSMTFDIPIELVNERFPYNPDMTYRDVQKTVNFGLSYGMTEFKLSDTLGIDKTTAREIIHKFFTSVPKVDQFLYTLGHLGRTRGYIKTAPPFSRIRWFRDWEHAVKSNNEYRLGEIERASKNAPIQGTNGDIIKAALINAQHEIDNTPQFNKVQIILAVYDEIITISPEDIAEEWRPKLQEIMVKAAQIVIKSIPVIAEVKISKYWTK
jgi:DNA polymerase-1